MMEWFDALAQCTNGGGFVIALLSVIIIFLVAMVIVEMNRTQKLSYGIHIIYDGLTPEQKYAIDHGWKSYLKMKE